MRISDWSSDVCSSDLNYPDAWANVYVGFDLSGTDPIRRAGEKSMTGFQWRNVDHYIPLSRGDRQLLKVARESGIGDGFTVPRHLPGEATGSCSLAVAPHARLPRSEWTRGGKECVSTCKFGGCPYA